MKYFRFARNALVPIKESISNHGLSKILFERSCKQARKRYAELGGEKSITVLAPNCIGGEIYHFLGLQFNSPLINASMKRLDFIKFCLSIDKYLELDPYISGHSYNGSPILTLEGPGVDRIDLRFVHDTDDKIVIDNWEKRKKRIIRNNCFIIMDNKDEHGKPLPDDIVEQINKFDCKKKIIFVANDTDLPNSKKIGVHQIQRYNYKKINGLYGFQNFFDFVSFLAR